jgi:hypothetical protein
MERWRCNFSNADLFVGRRGDITPEEFEDARHADIVLKHGGGRFSRKILDEGRHGNANRAE